MIKFNKKKFATVKYHVIGDKAKAALDTLGCDAMYERVERAEQVASHRNGRLYIVTVRKDTELVYLTACFIDSEGYERMVIDINELTDDNVNDFKAIAKVIVRVYNNEARARTAK